jgi:hypothetical protein
MKFLLFVPILLIALGCSYNRANLQDQGRGCAKFVSDMTPQEFRVCHGA